MAYTNVWDNSAPLGSQAANLIDDDLRNLKLDIGERLTSIFGIGTLNALDPVAPLFLNLKGAAASKIIPGATSLSLRNNADSVDNVLVNDSGDVIIRNSLVTKGNIGGRFLSIDDTSDVMQFQVTISGSGGLQIKPAGTATIKHFFLLDSTSNTKVDIDFQSGASTWSSTLTVNAGGLVIGAGGAAIGGNSSIVGTLLINGGSGASSLELRGATSNKRSLFYTTGGSVRWESFTDQNAEAGSNAGSNFQLARYDDSGTFIDNAISIFRSNGQIYFTSTTGAPSRFRLTGVVNNTGPTFLDIYGSPSGTPGTYAWLGGLFGDFNAGAPSKLGLFSNAIDIEIRSSNTSNTINLLNKVSLSTTGVAAGTSILDINKDNGASATLYVKINRAGSVKWYFGLDSADNFVIYQSDGSTQALRVSTGGSVVIGNQTGLFPSATLTDGSNQLDIGWNTNIFYFKQSVGTQRTINFRTSANVDVLAIDLSAQKVTAIGVLDVGTGYRIGNAAASGRFLRGDGTNFVSNTIQSGDLPTALTPTTLTVGGGSLLSKLLTGSVTVALNGGASISVGVSLQVTITVTGAAVGDAVFVNNPWAADDTRIGFTGAYVSAPNTVLATYANTGTAGTNIPTSRTAKAWVLA